MYRVEFSLTEADLLNLHMYFAAQSEVYRKQLRQHRTLVPAGYGVLAALLFVGQKYADAALFVAFAVAWFLLAPWWMLTRQRKQYEKRLRETAGDAIREPVTVELTPEGIHSSSYLGVSLHRYGAVDRIAENEGYTYVFIGKGMAIILPHDRIDPATLDKMRTEISQRKQEAQARAPEPGQDLLP